MSPSEAVRVEHEASRHRYVVHYPGGDAELVYAPAGDGVVDLRHTYVPPEARGDGVGDALVRAALADARAQGRRIIPTCPYVRAWLARHPEERDLVAP
jgi:predicted GNAT family acetyltransferase